MLLPSRSICLVTLLGLCCVVAPAPHRGRNRAKVASSATLPQTNHSRPDTGTRPKPFVHPDALAEQMKRRYVWPRIERSLVRLPLVRYPPGSRPTCALVGCARSDLNRLVLVSVVCFGSFISLALVALMIQYRCRRPEDMYQQCLRRDVDEDAFELEQVEDRQKESEIAVVEAGLPSTPGRVRSPRRRETGDSSTPCS